MSEESKNKSSQIKILLGIIAFLVIIVFLLFGWKITKINVGGVELVPPNSNEQNSNANFALHHGDEIYIKNLGEIDGYRWLNCVTSNATVILTSNTTDYSGTKWQVVDPDGDGVFSLKCLGTGNEATRWLDGSTSDEIVSLKPNSDEYSGAKWRLVVDNGTVRFFCMGYVEGAKWLNGNTVDGSINLVADPSTFSGTNWEIIK